MSSIIINGRFLVHRITGVERYAREITGELDRANSDAETIGAAMMLGGAE